MLICALSHLADAVIARFGVNLEAVQMVKKTQGQSLHITEVLCLSYNVCRFYFILILSRISSRRLVTELINI